MTLKRILITMNIICFSIMVLDKYFSKIHSRRIPEHTLLLTAVLGGSFGGMAAMILFRHKTRHLKFSIGLPLLVVLHIIIFFIIAK